MSCFKVDELFFSLDFYHPSRLIIPTTFPSPTRGFSRTKKTKRGSLEIELPFAFKISFTTQASIPLLNTERIVLTIRTPPGWLAESLWGQLILWLSESPPPTEIRFRSLNLAGGTNVNPTRTTTTPVFLGWSFLSLSYLPPPPFFFFAYLQEKDKHTVVETPKCMLSFPVAELWLGSNHQASLTVSSWSWRTSFHLDKVCRGVGA